MRAAKYFALAAALLLAACATPEKPGEDMRPPPPGLVMEIETPPVTAEEAEDEIDRMADIRGDSRLPPPAGAVEQLDCKVGSEDRHARMALEARGGQVNSFAYYAKWRPRTCSVYMQRDAAGSKWRVTEDGVTRVQSPHGSFLVRSTPGAYEFEFIDVERQAFCGMDGHTNGRMIVKRGTKTPQCSVLGLMDSADSPPLAKKKAYK